MTRPTRYVGYRDPRTPSSDKGLSPSRPYTGDGRTTRTTFDRVQAVFRQADGTPSPKSSRVIQPAVAVISSTAHGRRRVDCPKCGLLGSGLSLGDAMGVRNRHRLDGCN